MHEKFDDKLISLKDTRTLLEGITADSWMTP